MGGEPFVCLIASQLRHYVSVPVGVGGATLLEREQGVRCLPNVRWRRQGFRVVGSRRGYIIGGLVPQSRHGPHIKPDAFAVVSVAHTHHATEIEHTEADLRIGNV